MRPIGGLACTTGSKPAHSQAFARRGMLARIAW